MIKERIQVTGFGQDLFCLFKKKKKKKQFIRVRKKTLWSATLMGWSWQQAVTAQPRRRHRKLDATYTVRRRDTQRYGQSCTFYQAQDVRRWGTVTPHRAGVETPNRRRQHVRVAKNINPPPPPLAVDPPIDAEADARRCKQREAGGRRPARRRFPAGGPRQPTISMSHRSAIALS